LVTKEFTEELHDGQMNVSLEPSYVALAEQLDTPLLT
jgi:hypothetical protein